MEASNHMEWSYSRENRRIFRTDDLHVHQFPPNPNQNTYLLQQTRPCAESEKVTLANKQNKTKQNMKK